MSIELKNENQTPESRVYESLEVIKYFFNRKTYKSIKNACMMRISSQVVQECKKGKAKKIVN